MPRSMRRKTGKTDDRTPESVRFHILLEDAVDRIHQVASSIEDLEQRMLKSKTNLAECATELKKKAHPCSHTLGKEIEQRLVQVAEDMSRIGWSVVETSSELRRLQKDIARLGDRSGVLQQAHAT